MKRLIVIKNGIIVHNDKCIFEHLESLDSYMEIKNISNTYDYEETTEEGIIFMMSPVSNDYLLFGEDKVVCTFHDRNFKTKRIYDPE